MSLLQIEYVSPNSLRRYAGNARTHSKKQIKQIAKSIERFGFTNPLLISASQEVIAGHGRLSAAQLLGLPLVPIVILSTMSDAERRAYVLADNKLAENAGWDRDILAIELQSLLDVEFDDPELTGFSVGEIDGILSDAAEKSLTKPGPEDIAPALKKMRCPGREICGFSDLTVCFVAMQGFRRITTASWRAEWPT